MPGFWRATRGRLRACGHTDRAIAVVLLVVAVVWLTACGRAKAEDPPARIVISVGPADGVFETVGEALAAAYDELPGIDASTRHSLNSRTSADELERGEVDLALEGARTTYLAYRKGTPDYPAPHTKLRALAVLFPTVVHIVVHRLNVLKPHAVALEHHPAGGLGRAARWAHEDPASFHVGHGLDTTLAVDHDVHDGRE